MSDDKGFTPLAEDKPLFDFDVKRIAQAETVVHSFRKKVEAELLKDCPADSPQRHFCSDDTLVRYLCARDSNEQKALSFLQGTLKWRKENLDGVETVCQACRADPSAHCFHPIGHDAAGRVVIYSCAARASNKVVRDNYMHMAFELDNLFQGNTVRGKIVWLVDFQGFGFRDLDPRMAMGSMPMLANHYPERLGQMVLIDPPAIFAGLFNAVYPLLDPVTQRKIQFLRGKEKWESYKAAYWSHDPDMISWLECVMKLKCNPGNFPGPELSRKLKYEPTVLEMERFCPEGTPPYTGKPVKNGNCTCSSSVDGNHIQSQAPLEPKSSEPTASPDTESPVPQGIWTITGAAREDELGCSAVSLERTIPTATDQSQIGETVDAADRDAQKDVVVGKQVGEQVQHQLKKASPALQKTHQDEILLDTTEAENLAVIPKKGWFWCRACTL